jgi:hypothetical protein
MDITLSKVESVSLIQHKPSGFIKAHNTIVIYTEKGQVALELFGDKPLVIQWGQNEDA